MDGASISGLQSRIGEVYDFLRRHLSAEEIRMIENPASEESRRYVEANLPPEKRRVIDTGAKDEIVFAIIETMVIEEKNRAESGQPNGRFSAFDCIFPNSRENHLEYLMMNREWTIKEQALAHTTDSLELSRDSEKNLNGCRARVYYAITNPQKVDLLCNLHGGCDRRILCERKMQRKAG